jgi:hypothetical protein
MNNFPLVYAQRRRPHSSRLPRFGTQAAISCASISALHNLHYCSAASVSQTSDDSAIEGKDTPQANVLRYRGRRRSGAPLVALEAPAFVIPEWMSETYTAISTSWAAVRRLFLPDVSIRNKLPYYE